MQVHLISGLPEALLLAMLVVLGVLVASRVGPRLERACFHFAAMRVWKSALEAPRPAWSSLSTRAWLVVASGPFKAPFGASIALLTLSNKVSPVTATALLALLYALRCASTGQTHTERPLALQWRTQHGGTIRARAQGDTSAHPTGFEVPRATLHRLAARSHESLGRFEREDVRAYAVIAAVLMGARGGWPPLVTYALLLGALALPAWMLADARRAVVDSVPSRALSSERTVRRTLLTFVAAFTLSLPAVRQGHLLPTLLTALCMVFMFATTALEGLAYALGFGAVPRSRAKARNGLPDAAGNTLVVNPAAVRKVRYRRDIGISRAAERGVPLLRWMRLRAWVESFGFAQTMRASARADILLTSLVIAGWLL